MQDGLAGVALLGDGGGKPVGVGVLQERRQELLVALGLRDWELQGY